MPSLVFPASHNPAKARVSPVASSRRTDAWAVFLLSAIRRMRSGTRHPRFLNGSRQVGALVMLSERALMVDSHLMSFGSSVKCGARLQRARISSLGSLSLACKDQV